MSRTLCTFTIAALFLIACDSPGASPTADAGKPTAASPTKTDVAAKPGATAGAGGAAAPAQDLASCRASCDEGKQLPTDRATCRLNCDNAHGAPPAVAAAGAGGDPIADAVACLGRCHIQGGAGLEACTAGCKAVAAAAPVAPAPAALDGLSTCLGECHAEKDALPTNRATCQLNCEQEARVAGPAQPAAPR